MTRRYRSYLVKVARALGECQLVEFELKFYISQALELCQKRMKGRLPFGMSGDDYRDASLERLIEAFKKLSDCPPLVSRLKKFKDQRNFVAHRAIAVCMDQEGDFQVEAARALEKELSSIEKEASSLVLAINEENVKFLGHLYFDEVEEKG